MNFRAFEVDVIINSKNLFKHEDEIAQICTEIFIQNGHNFNHHLNDIALIKLPSPVPFKGLSLTLGDVKINKTFTLTGYLNSNVLGSINVVARDETFPHCQKFNVSFQKNGFTCYESLNNENLTIKTFGSPIFNDRRLVAVVSFMDGTAAVGTLILPHRDWILSHLFN